jgi:transglutaminase-like putative cysteine protease
MVYQGRWSYPGRWVKVAFVSVGVVGIPMGFSKFYGLEPAIALLIVAFVLKLLEMHNKRDAYIVILLAYFVAITEFLFFQTIPYTIYMFGAVTMITAALIGLHQTKSHLKPIKTLKTAAVLLGQSVPLMIVLFVLFPRISPLWTVPLPTDVGRTGVTDRMSPGDIALLTQSDGLAFKATFESITPRFSQLYWRGLVLSNFDGKTWTQDRMLSQRPWRYGQRMPAWTSNIEYQGEEYRYEIILEPSQQRWLFSLSVPELPDNRDVVMLHDFRLASRQRVRQRFRYELNSHLSSVLDRDLGRLLRYTNTQIPEGSNPLSQAFAKQMFERAGSIPTYVNDVLRMYYVQSFFYTLKPPLLGEDGIDDFLFVSRRGFCEHFAGSFTFLMRAAGIPARVVLGYQGGEYNPTGNFVSVRQFDAHAWAEVWLEDGGWIRFDPTGAVAPDRIERGLQAAVEEENTFLENTPLSLFKYRHLLWLTDLRLQIDAIGHYWDGWVVGYTPETQESLIQNYFGDIDRKRLGMIMLSVFFALLAVIGVAVLAKRSSTRLAPVDNEYLKFCSLMAKLGYARKTGEGPLDYASRLGLAKPELREQISRVTNVYVDQNYINSDTSDIADLKREVRRLRYKTLTANNQ